MRSSHTAARPPSAAKVLRTPSREALVLSPHVEVFAAALHELDAGILLPSCPPRHVQRPRPDAQPRVWEYKSLPDIAEDCLRDGHFSRPMSFSWRAFAALRDRARRLRRIHDNRHWAGFAGEKRQGWRSCRRSTSDRSTAARLEHTPSLWKKSASDGGTPSSACKKSLPGRCSRDDVSESQGRHQPRRRCRARSHASGTRRRRPRHVQAHSARVANARTHSVHHIE